MKLDHLTKATYSLRHDFEQAVAKMLHTPLPPEKQVNKAAKKERTRQRRAQADGTQQHTGSGN